MPAQTPTLESHCGEGEQILELQVGGVSRGAVVIAVDGGGRAWLPTAALRGGEEGYTDAELRCADGLRRRLRPELRWAIDPEQQRLALQPDARWLPMRVLEPASAPPAPSSTLGILSIRYAAALSRAASTGQLEHSASLRAAYQVGLTQISVGLGEVTRQGQRSVTAQGSLGRSWDGHNSARLVAGQDVSRPGLQGRLHGLQVALAGGPEWTWPALPLELPLGGRVSVAVDGAPLADWTVPPSQVTLRGVVVPSGGVLEVTVEDELGTRTLGGRAPGAATLLPPGQYTLSADAGWFEGELRSDEGAQQGRAGWFAAVAGRYGLGERWTLDVQGTVLDGLWRAQLLAVGDWGTQRARLGLSWQDWPGEPTGVALLTDYSVAPGPVQLGIQARLPLAEPGASSVTLSGRYRQPPFSVSVSGGYAPRLGGWTAGLSGSYQLGRAWLISARARASMERLQAGLTLSWSPDARLWLQAGVGANGSGGAQGGPAPLLEAPQVQVQWRPTEQHTLGLTAGPGGVTGQYAYHGALDAQALAGSDGGLSAQLRGGVNAVAGTWFVGQAADRQRFVRLQTGIPDLPVAVDGRAVGRTDAQGTLTFGIEPGERRVSVDLSTLPLEVSVQASSLELPRFEGGLLEIDWRRNFSRNRVVQFTALGAPAGSGEVRLERGERVGLDGLGRGLVPVVSAPLYGTLFLPDGTTCPVVIPPEAPTVGCA